MSSLIIIRSKVNCGQVSHSDSDKESAVCDGPWLVTLCHSPSPVTLHRPTRQKALLPISLITVVLHLLAEARSVFL